MTDEKSGNMLKPKKSNEKLKHCADTSIRISKPKFAEEVPNTTNHV